MSKTVRQIRFSLFSALSAAAAAAAVGVIAGSANAAERHIAAHEHGVSTLQVAQQGSTMMFVLQAPGSDIVGFEHAAESDAEKTAVQSALAVLEMPGALFSLPSAAKCSVSEKEAEFEAEEEHAEFHVEWTVTCGEILKATRLKIGFFEEFERAGEIEAEITGDKGQGAVEIERGTADLDLTPYLALRP